MSKIFLDTQHKLYWIYKTDNMLAFFLQRKSMQEKVKPELLKVCLAGSFNSTKNTIDVLLAMFFQGSFLLAMKQLGEILRRTASIPQLSIKAVSVNKNETTNLIESAFTTAMLRLRSLRAKNCCSRKTIISILFNDYLRYCFPSAKKN
ncbi:MAG: hypothetical protein ACEY3J_04660 [Arsenophonus sp.]